MKKLFRLIQGDLKNIYRDPMLLFVFFAPVLLGVVLKFALPYFSTMVNFYFQIELQEHYPFIAGLFLNLIPLLQGMMVGFMILDDRDEKVLAYLAITPLGKTGYFLYRIASSIISSLLFAYLFLLIVGLVRIKILSLLPVILIAALEAPLMAAFLGTYAANKVEGFALAKASGIIYLGPLLAYLLRTKWTAAAGIFPTYWVSKGFLAIYNGGIRYWFYILIGLAFHIFLLYFLQQKFKQRIE